jgi:hypothetical protein
LVNHLLAFQPSARSHILRQLLWVDDAAPLARRSMGRTRPPQLRIDRLKVDSVARRVYGEIVLGSCVGRARLRH